MRQTTQVTFYADSFDEARSLLWVWLGHERRIGFAELLREWQDTTKTHRQVRQRAHHFELSIGWEMVA